ncbi:RNA-binding protein 5-like protein [Leishmania mexicana MHOM/GT/2001/U1103]|uniref:RNA-binding protein 5-like protein n=1 Tax=Leishmania mexicana (strain MHOM/GT/2001/U1103) TaxID=929439 RepID=E9AML0_LEIMU|nr:RNA-binding protein 5-like protein [Leishmania mexicana MHOM/GT/2001/U1103]CBZ24165.1 RNA-binding protein 5-like protein [Leishmania mexicana MHOM/GT/2001/U1103]
MTLNFDILAGNNADWGFDCLPTAPERSPTPALFTPFGVTAGTESDLMMGSPLQALAPRVMSGSLQTMAQSVQLSDYGENVSPMKNDSLNMSVQASDPAARAYDSNLYVASLPEWFTDADLHELFKRFGPIVSAKVMCHKGTHHCKGYGFVLFQRTDDAAVARSEMIGHVVGGNKIQVRRARSAASAPLTEAASTVSGTFTESPGTTRTSSSNVTPINYAAHMVPAQQPSFNPLYPATTPLTPTYVLTSPGAPVQNATHTQPAMLVAIPNGRTMAQGAGDVMYMVLASSAQQMQSTSAIY